MSIKAQLVTDVDDGEDGIMLYQKISPVRTVGDISNLTNRDMCHDSQLN
jgi:hypothetical protein